MNSYQQRKLATFQAELAFIKENGADFPNDSAGDKAAQALTEIVGQILVLSGEQQSNAARQQTGIKGDKLQQLIELLQMMNRAAKAMADEIDGIENLFRMPRRRSTDVWLATARAFQADSAPYEAGFLEYDLPPSFRADLTTLIGEVESAQSAAEIAGAGRAGATGGLTELFKEAGKLSNKLDAIVKNKYRNSARKLAGWAVASHVEAAPKFGESEAAGQSKAQ